MLHQIVGASPWSGEKHLGCIQFDEGEPLRSTDAWCYAFLAEPENPSTNKTYCTLRGDFIVFSHVKSKTTTPEPSRDVLFFYRNPVKKAGSSKWKFLIPGHNGNSSTGVVVHGGDALDGLHNMLSVSNLS